MSPVRLFIPILIIGLFILYILYLGLIKKDLKSKIKTVVYPGVFFILIWVILYFLILK